MLDVLYISYDGMTDPLGQSQVLPYIIELSGKGYTFSLLSCEKKQRLSTQKTNIKHIVDAYNINWQYTIFTPKPPIVAKYFDIWKLKKKAVEIYKNKPFKMVHCRSYVAAEVGMYLKKKFGVKFLFDMRGFWVDERVDGGLWNLKNPVYKYAYKTYKKKETAYLKNADAIICLTEASKIEMQNWQFYTPQKNITVIPCSTDFNHFKMVTPALQQKAKTILGIPNNTDLIIGYLGSIGTWYMLPTMLQFFKQVLLHYPSAKFVFITPEPPATIIKQAEVWHIAANSLIIKEATRQQVPLYMAACQLGLFFIKPSYSKISSSPTKLGELLAMGLPVICNSRIGDVEAIIKELNAGICLPNFEEISFKKAISEIPQLLKKNAEEIRANAFEYYNLKSAADKYAKVYKLILNN